MFGGVPRFAQRGFRSEARVGLEPSPPLENPMGVRFNPLWIMRVGIGHLCARFRGLDTTFLSLLKHYLLLLSHYSALLG